MMRGQFFGGRGCPQLAMQSLYRSNIVQFKDEARTGSQGSFGIRFQVLQISKQVACPCLILGKPRLVAHRADIGSLRMLLDLGMKS